MSDNCNIDSLNEEILKLFPDLIFILDQDGTFICNTNENSGLLCQPLKKLIGKNVRDVLPFDIAGNIIFYIAQTIKTHSVSCFEFKLHIKEKDYIFEARFVSKDNNQVIMFVRDLTEQKNRLAETICYGISDKLTGIYNRAYFDEQINRLDVEKQLPISIIMGDVNGLKLANDVFGHKEGDILLKNIAYILMSAIRKDDIVARLGGDEFGIILPNTCLADAKKVCKRIKNSCQSTYDGKVKPSISIGAASKENMEQDIMCVFMEAEDNMYKTKIMESKNTRNSIIETIQATICERSFETDEHMQEVKSLCEEIGKVLKLSFRQVDDLILLAVLRDIGEIAITDNIITKKADLTIEEWRIMKKHPEIGYRIAEASKELSRVSEFILYHHERWDGKGYPQGLKGTQIPLLSRIISIICAYDAMTHNRPYKEAVTPEEAIAEIEKCGGTQFDPQICASFVEMVKCKLKQNI